MATYKKDIENFEYNTRYYVPNEHAWCFMADAENVKKYTEKREEYFKPRCKRVQSDLELTGQIGPYTGDIPNNPIG